MLLWPLSEYLRRYFAITNCCLVHLGFTRSTSPFYGLLQCATIQGLFRFSDFEYTALELQTRCCSSQSEFKHTDCSYQPRRSETAACSSFGGNEHSAIYTVTSSVKSNYPELSSSRSRFQPISHVHLSFRRQMAGCILPARKRKYWAGYFCPATYHERKLSHGLDIRPQIKYSRFRIRVVSTIITIFGGQFLFLYRIHSHQSSQTPPSTLSRSHRLNHTNEYIADIQPQSTFAHACIRNNFLTVPFPCRLHLNIHEQQVSG